MRYRLRTLLIVLALGPLLLAAAWTGYSKRRDEALWREALSHARAPVDGPGLLIGLDSRMVQTASPDEN